MAALPNSPGIFWKLEPDKREFAKDDVFESPAVTLV